MKFLTGTVYSKALAIFLAASLLLLGAVAALTQLIIFREFNRAEEREMQAMLQRFSVVMERETRPLQVSVNGWARSDYVVESLAKRPEKLQETISPQILTELSVDFLALYDRAGRLRSLITSQPELKGQLELAGLGGKVWAPIPTDSTSFETRVGPILVGDRLCSVVMSPIGSVNEPLGMLVGGKFAGPGTWQFFEGLFTATIKFNVFKNTVGNEAAGRDMVRLLNEQEVVVEAEDVSQITGYRLIKGIVGKPIGYVSISQPRPLRQQGLRAIQVFLSGICLAGGGLVLVVWALLDRTILARIKDLTRKLDAEKQSDRLPVKLDFQGEDELGVLARSIEDLAVLLENTQTQYRAVVEDQTEMICRFDAAGQVLFFNQVFAQKFALADVSFGKANLVSILPPDAAEELLARFRALSVEMPLADYSHQILFPSGESRWFRSTLRKNFSAEGDCLGGQWVAADISAQILAQTESMDLERRFRRLFETASDGILVVDEETLEITDINPGMGRMLMIAGAEVLGKSLGAVAVFAPCLDMVNYFRRSPRGETRGARFNNECCLNRGDGSALYVELRCSEYEVAGRRYIQTNFRNISERVLGERELRKLSAKLLRLQDDERRRIARELHDSTAQNLSAVEMNLSLLEPLVSHVSEKAVRLVSEARQIAGECSRELRNISYLLHPPLIDEVGLAFAVKWFVDGFSQRTGIETKVEIEEDFPRLDGDIELPLFRVVQEALSNIYRHSGAKHAWVTLQCEGRFLNLLIRDDGVGFGGRQKGGDVVPENFSDLTFGVGLAGMRERLANLGGNLDIENSAEGVTVSIRLTLDHLHAPNHT